MRQRAMVTFPTAAPAWSKTCGRRTCQTAGAATKMNSARLLIILALLLAAPAVALAQQSAPSGTQILGATQNRATINAAVVIATGNTFQTVLAALTSGGAPRQSLT